MARARNIKPGFFTNEVLGELDPLARILFAGLWCHADREGRLEDRLKRLKPQILPFDDCDIESLAQCLHDAKLILRYVVDGKRYIQILTFKDHQNPHVKECASTIPAPGLPDTNTGAAGLIPSSLIPSSLIPDSLISGFADFWKIYPKGTPRKPAIEKWKSKKLGRHLDAILADVQWRILNDQKWKEGFIPHASTYLHQERWKDEHVDAPVIPIRPEPVCQFVDRPGASICGMKPALASPLYGGKPICGHHQEKLTPTPLSFEKVQEHLAEFKRAAGVRA